MPSPRKKPTTAGRVLELVRKNGTIRSSEATAAGATRALLSRLVQAGKLARLTRGVYTVPEADVSIHTSLALAQRRVPNGTVCLLSALQFHDLTTQAPNEVWMLIKAKAWRPSPDYPPVRLVHASGEALSYGIEEHLIDGQRVRVTSKAKTVADCFKYRSKVGLDVALEALRDYRRKRGNMDELWRAAKVDRVARVMRPYLEAMT